MAFSHDTAEINLLSIRLHNLLRFHLAKMWHNTSLNAFASDIIRCVCFHEWKGTVWHPLKMWWGARSKHIYFTMESIDFMIVFESRIEFNIFSKFSFLNGARKIWISGLLNNGDSLMRFFFVLLSWNALAWVVSKYAALEHGDCLRVWSHMDLVSFLRQRWRQ